MKKTSFYTIGMILFFGGVLLSCNLTQLGGVMPLATGTPSPELDDQLLLATVKAQVMTEIALQESQLQAAATQTQAAFVENLSFDQKIQTSVAQTQEAEETNRAFVQVVQTAVAQTQIALTPTLSLEQQVQFALARTQTSLNLTQTAYGLTQVALLHTPAISLMSSQTLVPDPFFTGAYVYRYGFLQNNKYLVTLQLANNINGAYSAKVGGKSYKCSVIQDYPNRLYCTGPSVRGGSQSVLIYDNASNHLVYTGQVVLPQWTPTWSRPSSRCYEYYPYDRYCVTPTSWNRCNYCGGSCCYMSGCGGSCNYSDENGKCYYYDNNGRCRYCKTGNFCR